MRRSPRNALTRCAVTALAMFVALTAAGWMTHRLHSSVIENVMLAAFIAGAATLGAMHGELRRGRG